MSLMFALYEVNMQRSIGKRLVTESAGCRSVWKAKMALRLLKEGIGILPDIAQATNVPKSALCTISKFLRKNEKIGQGGMLNLSKVKGGPHNTLSREEEAMIAERFIFAGKRVFAAGKDILSP